MIDRKRTLKGAICGAVGAALWAVQQPLDKRLFGCRYDDVELLGKALTRSEAWYPVGFAMHMTNGALFGATYANLAPRLAMSPAWSGPALAATEHLVLWPLVAVTDRLHPARDELPALSGSRRAFLQALYRHLLFGLVLGELERRLRDEPEPDPPEPEADYSSNGHGLIEHAVGVGSGDEE